MTYKPPRANKVNNINKIRRNKNRIYDSTEKFI